MRRHKILGAVGAIALSTQTGAVELSLDGRGEVLIFPVTYALNDFDSLITIRNTSTQSIAARAVFHDGIDGALIKTLTLYLGPEDTWAAAFTRSGDGFALLTSDRTCTDANFGDADQLQNRKLAIGDQGQTWLEVHTLGAFADADAATFILDSEDELDQCPQIDAIRSVALEAIENPLTGDGQLINVLAGLSFPISPTALRDFGQASKTSMLNDRAQPSLADATPTEAAIGGQLLRFDAARDAVSATLAVNSIETAYTIEEVIDARTDLLLTFPTRHLYSDTASGVFSVNTDLEHSEQGQELTMHVADRQGRRVDKEGQLESPTPKCTPVLPPSVTLGPVVSQSQLNISSKLHYGENGPDALVEFSDTELPSFEVIDEFDCGLNYSRGLPSENGFFRVMFSDFSIQTSDGQTIAGLPVLPVSLSRAANGAVQVSNEESVLANYGWTNTLSIERR